MGLCARISSNCLIVGGPKNGGNPKGLGGEVSIPLILQKIYAPLAPIYALFPIATVS